MNTYSLRWIIKSPDKVLADWTWYEGAAVIGRVVVVVLLFAALLYFALARYNEAWYEANGWQDSGGGLMYRQMETGDRCYIQRQATRLSCVSP